MDNLNYIFFEEFKRLDKLCGELYADQHGISKYIDDMRNVPKMTVGKFLIGMQTWNNWSDSGI